MFKLVSKVKSKVYTLRHFKVDPVLKTEKKFKTFPVLAGTWLLLKSKNVSQTLSKLGNLE